MGRLTSDMVLRAYAMGIFPMADGRDDPELFWVEPEMRGILPLNGVHISRSMAKVMRRQPFDVRVNTAFHQVMLGCASREETWINAEIERLYVELHHRGYAHSVECWQGAELVGGLYGLALGGAFFGESMFSRRTNASKVALLSLAEMLSRAGYQLLDTQFITSHLSTLGAVEIPRSEYLQRLDRALASPVADLWSKTKYR